MLALNSLCQVKGLVLSKTPKIKYKHCQTEPHKHDPANSIPKREFLIQDFS